MAQCHKSGYFTLRLRFCLVLTTSLVLAGCSAGQKPAEGSPEALLEAEGEWALVEDNSSLSPEQSHLKSRQQVRPEQTGGSSGYTQSAARSGVNDDVHFRVLRLERQMDALQGDFNKLLPPLAGRAQADRELNAAVEDIQSSKREDMRAALPIVPKAEVVPPVRKDARTAGTMAQSVSSGGALRVSSLRVGEHPGKTRLVLDVTGPAKFTAEIDSGENLMIVELPGAAWAGDIGRTFSSSPLLKSYSVQPSGVGSRLVIELKKAARLVMKSSLPPNDHYGHRVVLDLAAN